MIQRISFQIEVIQTRVDGSPIEGSAVVLVPMHGGDPLTAEIYMVKHGDDLLRFESYRVARVVDHPSKASHFQRLRDAQARCNSEHYLNGIKRVSPEQLRPVKARVRYEVRELHETYS